MVEEVQGGLFAGAGAGVGYVGGEGPADRFCAEERAGVGLQEGGD